MRIRICTSIIVLLAFLAGGLLISMSSRAAGPVAGYDKIIRLHVIASSDRADDQSVKLRVRDVILREFGYTFSRVQDRDAAEKLLRHSLPRIEDIARAELKRAGMNYGAHAEYGTFDFPKREYWFATLPPGRYRALRVTLGSARGKNWWCMLYPPLCFVSEDEDAEVRKAMAQSGEQPSWRLGVLETLLKKKGLLLDAFWRAWAAFFGS